MRALFASTDPALADEIRAAWPDCELEPLDGGRAVLAALDSASYDAVVADLRLPDSNAIELVRQIRARGLKLPIIVIGDDEARLRYPALDAGADDYLSRSPKLARTVSAAVRAALDRRRLESANDRKGLHVLYVGQNERVRRQIELATNVQVRVVALPIDPTDLPTDCHVALVEGDDYTTVAAIREAAPDLPIVVLTGLDRTEAQERFMPAGATAVIPRTGDFLGQIVPRIRAVAAGRALAAVVPASRAAARGESPAPVILRPAFASSEAALATLESITKSILDVKPLMQPAAVAQTAAAGLVAPPAVRPARPALDVAPIAVGAPALALPPLVSTARPAVAPHVAVQAARVPAGVPGVPWVKELVALTRKAALADLAMQAFGELEAILGTASTDADRAALLERARTLASGFSAVRGQRTALLHGVAVDREIGQMSQMLTRLTLGIADLRLGLSADRATAMLSSEELLRVVTLLVMTCREALPAGGSVSVETRLTGMMPPVGQSSDRIPSVSVQVTRVGLAALPVAMPPTLADLAGSCAFLYEPVTLAGSVAGVKVLLPIDSDAA